MKIEEITDIVLKEYKFKTMVDDESIFVYKDKQGYYINGEPQLKYICANLPELAGSRNTNTYSSLRLNVIGKTYTDRKTFVPPVGLINLSNGVLNINTKELLDRSPDYNFQEMIPIKFDTNAVCPMFDKFISDVIPKGDIKLIQKWFGYHFLHDNRYKVAMLLLGVKNSGKSLLLSILEEFVGQDNCSHFELRDFDNTMSHSIPSLYGKVANTYADMTMKMLRDVGKFKVLTGNDYVSTRFHHKEPFSFKPYTKITVSTNKCPHIGGAVLNDEAYWSRIKICQFNVPRYGISDEELGQKIISSEMSGVLNWALEGYNKVLKSGFKDYPAVRSKKIWIDSAMFVEEVDKAINGVPDLNDRSLFNDHGVPIELNGILNI